jgi:predicted ATPase
LVRASALVDEFVDGVWLVELAPLADPALVAQAMPAHGKVLVIEQLFPPANEPSFGKWLDLHMLVMLGSCERTRAGYGALLGASGFELANVIPTRSGTSIIEGLCASGPS